MDIRAKRYPGPQHQFWVVARKNHSLNPLLHLFKSKRVRKEISQQDEENECIWASSNRKSSSSATKTQKVTIRYAFVSTM